MNKTKQRTDVSKVNIGKLLADHEPVVFKNISAGSALLGGSGASGSTLLDELSNKIGSKTILAISGFSEDEGLLSYSDPTRDSSAGNTLSGACPFERFARQIRKMSEDKEPGYLFSQLSNLDESAPELVPMIRHLGEGFALDGEAIWNLWLGSGNHRVNTHYDKVENFYFVLQGKKVFEIFEPASLPDLYSGPYEGGPSGIPESVVDANNPDLERYPRYSRAIENSQVAEVFAGDMLYLPANWWHNVKSEGLNISANLWWSDIGKVERLRADRSFLQLLSSIKTLPEHWKDYWRVNVDHYVFCRNGDPFPYLPRERQGIAGEPGTAVSTEIAQRTRDLAQEISRLELSLDLSDGRLRLRCADLLNVTLENQDRVEVRLGANKVLAERYEVLEILRAFSEARRPLDVYAGKVAQSYDTDEFAKKLVEFVRCGVLVISYT